MCPAASVNTVIEIAMGHSLSLAGMMYLELRGIPTISSLKIISFFSGLLPWTLSCALDTYYRAVSAVNWSLAWSVVPVVCLANG